MLGAEAALRGAEAVYRELIGIEPAALENPAKLPRLPVSLEKAMQTARRENPDLKNAQEMSKSGKYTSYSTVGSVLPQINLTGRYSKTEDPSLSSKGLESEATSLQMNVTVPIFLGGKSIAAISASQDVSDALTQNVHIASNTVEREVIVAWNNMQATKSAIEATQEQIRASELALEGVRQENTLGTRTNLDVLNAEQSLLDARVSLVQAERNQYVAAYNLLATTGRLTARPVLKRQIFLKNSNCVCAFRAVGVLTTETVMDEATLAEGDNTDEIIGAIRRIMSADEEILTGEPAPALSQNRRANAFLRA